MADVETKKNTRKLPPLSHEPSPNTDIPLDERKPRKKKKKIVKDSDDAPPEQNEVPPLDGTEETPRKKKKKRVPREEGDEAPQSRADEAPESTAHEETPRKKRRKKRLDEQTQESPEHDVDGGSVNPEEKLVKKKRKKRKTPREPEAAVRFNEGMAAELEDLDDDVIDASKGGEFDEDDEEETHQITHKGLKSQPEDSLYIEKRNHFHREDKRKLAKRLAEEEERRKASSVFIQPSKDTLQFALVTHRFFRKFSLICHGLLAGMALIHCIMVFLVLSNHSYTFFLDIYSVIALPLHQVFYFLFAVCTVSAFDRFDFAGMTRVYLVKCVTLQNGAISGLIYFISALVSLSIVQHDDLMNQYTFNQTSWQNEATSRGVLNEWSILNAVRAGGALLGWVILALQPSTDKLGQNLLQGDENVLGDDVNLTKVSAA